MLETYDKNLVERIQSGETKAETELFKKYSTQIARMVSHKLGVGNTDWRDLAGDIQMVLLISLRQGKFDMNRGASLGSYIYGITVNIIRDYFKTQKKRPLITESLSERLVGVAEAYDIEKKETQLLLYTLINKLKLKYKEVLYLRYYKELSITEISEKINLPPRRVSERINYALKLIRKKCEKEEFFSIFGSVFLIFI